MKVQATLVEYDRHTDKNFIYDVEGTYENGILTYNKDGSTLSLRHEEDLTPEGCRIKLLSYEEVTV